MSVDNITTQDKLNCVQREVKQREWVYPRLVEQGKMSAGKAALEIATMRAIVEDYRTAAQKEQLI